MRFFRWTLPPFTFVAVRLLKLERIMERSNSVIEQRNGHSLSHERLRYCSLCCEWQRIYDLSCKWQQNRGLSCECVGWADSFVKITPPHSKIQSRKSNPDACPIDLGYNCNLITISRTCREKGWHALRGAGEWETGVRGSSIARLISGNPSGSGT